MNEFQLIRHFFARQKQRQDVVLGIGDDCAVLTVPAEHELLVSMDTLISGVHFPVFTSPFDMAYKALAVNLSDLAAMGANPAWFTLGLTLPKVDTAWLDLFSEGLFQLADSFQVELIGGDTTKGSLAITIQVHGFVPKGCAVKRQGAKPGDLIYVTNTLGDAGLALQHIQEKIKLHPNALTQTLPRLNRPYPRIKEGLLLRSYASAMIDISDGLLADLDHILKQNKVGALLDVHALPLSESLNRSMAQEDAWRLALTAGDDYELCFTVSPTKKEAMEECLRASHCPVHCIGLVTANESLVLQKGSQIIDIHNWQRGYLHF